MSLLPTVLWAQRKDKLLVTIDVPDVVNEKVEILPNKISFKGIGGPEKKPYVLELDLLHEIDPAGSNYRVLARHVPMVLKKKEGGFWTRLLKDSKKFNHIRVDWNQWKEEDDEDYASGFGGQYDFDSGPGCGVVTVEEGAPDAANALKFVQIDDVNNIWCVSSVASPNAYLRGDGSSVNEWTDNGLGTVNMQYYSDTTGAGCLDYEQWHLDAVGCYDVLQNNEFSDSYLRLDADSGTPNLQWYTSPPGAESWEQFYLMNVESD